MSYIFESVTGTTGSLAFKFNGQFALKNYNVEIVNGNRLKVVSTSNEMFSLLEADVTEVEINGTVYSDPKAAQVALTSLVYSDSEPVILTKEQYIELASAVQSADNGQLFPNTTMPQDGWKIGWYTAAESSESPGTNYPNQNNLKAIEYNINRFYFNGTTWTIQRDKFEQNITQTVTNINNSYELNPDQIVPSEALYNDGTLAGDSVKRIDFHTGTDVNYRETVQWIDGTTMNDSKIDGVVFRKKGADKYEKLQFAEALTPDFWGAKGDGITDDTESLKNALKFSILSGTKLNSKKDKTYLITQNIILDTVNSKAGTIIDFNDSVIKSQGANIQIKHDNGTPYLITSLTTDAKKGDTFFNLASVTGVQKGDLLEVESPALTSGGVNVLQYYIVNDLDANKVYVDAYVVNDITGQQIIDDGKSGDIVVRLRKMGQDLTIRNLTIIGDRNKPQTTFLVAHQNNLLIENVHIIDATREGLYVQYCGLSKVRNYSARGYGYVKYDQFYNSVPSSPDGLSFGYGLIHARCAISFVDDSEGFYGWHAFDAARGVTFITYSNCRGFKNGFTYSTHEGAWDVRYLNCNSDGGPGITTRCVFLTVKGGNLKSNKGHCIGGIGVFESLIEDVILDNVYGDVNKGTAIYAPAFPIFGAGAKSAGRFQTAIIRKNTLINQSQASVVRSEIVVADNNVVKNSEGYRAMLGLGATKTIIAKNNLFFDTQQNAIQLYIYNDLKAILEGNMVSGTMEPGLSAFFGIFNAVNANTTDIQILGNKGNGTSLVRNYTANCNARFTRIIGNENYERLFLSDTGFKMVDVINNVGSYPINVSGGTLLPTGQVFGNESTLVSRFGTIGSRQGSGLYLSPGQWYVSTNTNMLSIWDGTTWRDSVGLSTTTTQGTVLKSAAVASAVKQDATDLASAIQLVNELKSVLNAKISADIASGQQSS